MFSTSCLFRRRILFEIKACEKFNRRHKVDIRGKGDVVSLLFYFVVIFNLPDTAGIGSITYFSRIVSNKMKFGPLFTSTALLKLHLSVLHDPVKRFIVFGTTKLQNIVCI